MYANTIENKYEIDFREKILWDDNENFQYLIINYCSLEIYA